MSRKEIIDYLKNYTLTGDCQKDLLNIVSACNDYMKETKEYDIQYFFKDLRDLNISEEDLRLLIKVLLDNLEDYISII